MQLFGAWLIDACAIRAINSASQSIYHAVTLTLDGLDITYPAPVFRVLKLRTTGTIDANIEDATERAYQHRRFAARNRDHLPI